VVVANRVVAGPRREKAKEGKILVWISSQKYHEQIGADDRLEDGSVVMQEEKQR
jgi:hypothetical protein